MIFRARPFARQLKIRLGRVTPLSQPVPPPPITRTEPPSQRVGWQRIGRADWLRLVLWAVLVIALGPHLLAFLGHTWEVVRWPFQIDYDEGLNLSAAWHLSQGHNIYANSHPDGFIAAPYPFLYFLLNAIGIKLFGIGFGVGRSLSALATVAIGGLIGWGVWLVARRSGVGRLDSGGAALVSGLVWFGLPPVYTWGSFYKQDMTAIAIALLSLVLVYRWQDSPRLWWAAPLMALAFFAKQNELMAAVIGCSYMMLRDWRRGWKLALLTGLCMALPFGLLNSLTKNGYYNHIIGYQLVPWNFEDMARRLGQVVSDHPVLITLAGAYIIGCLIWLGRAVADGHGWGRLVAAWRVMRGWLFPFYLVAATFSLFTIGAYQGNFNLVLDLFPPLLIVVGSGLAWLVNRAGRLETGRERLVGLAAGIVGLALVGQFLGLADPGTYYHSGSMPSVNQRNLMEGLQKQIAATPGPLLTEDVYLAFSMGRAVPYDNLYHMRLQSEEGKWDDRQFLQDLRDRRFALVLLEHGSKRWTEGAWQVLNQNYELVFPEGIDLWRPRPRPTTPEYALTSCSLRAATDRGEARMLGWSQGATNLPLQPGQALTLTTYWQPTTKFNGDYTLYVHLLDANGQVVAQRDASPTLIGGTGLPFSQWQPGQSLLLDQTLPLPANLSPGNYRLSLGAYRPQNGQLQHLQPACDGGSVSGDEIILGPVGVGDRGGSGIGGRGSGSKLKLPSIVNRKS